MTTTAASGWGSSYLTTTPAGEVNLDPAERLAVQQTLARYAFALDHGDLAALEASCPRTPPGRPRSSVRSSMARSSDARRFSTWCEMQRKRKPSSEGTT